MFLINEANGLEDAFFLKQDQEIIEQLQQIKKMQQNKEALSAVSGISNDHVLEKLVALEIQPQVVAALVAVPLILVAWADGDVDEEERKAILAMIEKHGIADGSVQHELLENWLEHRPEPKLFEAWSHYIAGLCNELSPDERTEFRDELLGDVQAIAESSGGFLGIGKVSKEEKQMLEKLKNAFVAAAAQ